MRHTQEPSSRSYVLEPLRQEIQRYRKGRVSAASARR